MDFKTVKFPAIMEWCAENNQLDWLEAKVNEKVMVKVYPKVKGDKGRLVSDKSQTPKEVEAPISYVAVKRAFFEKFMPEKLPKKKSKNPTMIEQLASFRASL